jgi:hypothetical protein
VGLRVSRYTRSRTLVLWKSKEQERRNGTRWRIQLERKVQDAWIGVFWNTTIGPSGRWAVLDVWITVIPMLPIHLFFNRKPVDLWEAHDRAIKTGIIR